MPDPNVVSTMFEIEFGDTRLVLGSDLTLQGWTDALQVRPELGAHHGLKVPHHGSRAGVRDGGCSIVSSMWGMRARQP
jgi:beta-lactamase superfamily II metal-dependent hydrolase